MRDARGRGHINVWSDQGCSAESNGGWPHTLSAYNTLTLKGIGDNTLTLKGIGDKIPLNKFPLNFDIAFPHTGSWGL